jgi:hypothetical protein
VSLYAWAVRDGDVASTLSAPPAPVAKTRQTTSTRTGDDGDYEKGVATSPRFTDNGDGTVTDNLTGLMWTQDANIGQKMTWNAAIDYSNNLSLGTEGCGVNYTDWRLPNIREMQSLVDFGKTLPALPSGHPFSKVQTTEYWSSTTHYTITYFAWRVRMAYGRVDISDKSASYYVWPVRGGN